MAEHVANRTQDTLSEPWGGLSQFHLQNMPLLGKVQPTPPRGAAHLAAIPHILPSQLSCGVAFGRCSDHGLTANLWLQQNPLGTASPLPSSLHVCERIHPCACVHKPSLTIRQTLSNTLAASPQWSFSKDAAFDSNAHFNFSAS